MGRKAIFPERDAEIFRLRKEGLTLRSIGERFGISGGRVRQICSKAERKERFLALSRQAQ